MIEGVSVEENDKERECMWERMIEGVSVEENDRERVYVGEKKELCVTVYLLCV